MKRDDEWMETNSNFHDWDNLDMKQFISEVQADALRSAAQIVHKDPITAYTQIMKLAFEVDP